MQTGILMLETGIYFKGKLFGYIGETSGEVIFNTGIVGYEEILTDPSYKGQIVVMTYPHIGNYGITYYDFESIHPQVEGFVVKEFSKNFSNWQAKSSIEKLFKKYEIVGIEGVDTRALTKYIREKGSMRGIITDELSLDKVYKKLQNVPSIIGRDLIKEVTCQQVYTPFSSPELSESISFSIKENPFINLKDKSAKFKVVVLDCGCKFNILRLLRYYRCELIVVPADTSADKILNYSPDGILLSNGPGDPEGAPYVFKTVEKLINYQIKNNSLNFIPIFGICLGHQMIALALGGKTYKLKFGHHGINHPVKNLSTTAIEITSQNHNFAVEMEEINGKLFVKGNRDLEVTHINLNDYSCEGLRHKSLPIFAVQYHPESAPGPHDSKYLFEEFVNLMDKRKKLVLY